MEFRRLLGKFDNEEIITNLIELYYKEEELDPTGYIQTLDELRKLTTKESEYTIICKKVKVFDDYCYKITGYIDTEEDNYDVSTIDWKIVLDSVCVIDNISELDFLTHCLYELTWFGFSYMDVNKKIGTIFNEIEATK